MSDQDLRQALLGTWRLISCQNLDAQDADGTLLKPLGDNPHGYLVYMRDGHLFVQYAARERPELFGRSAHGFALLETAEADTELGFGGYCGVLGEEVVHRVWVDVRNPAFGGTAIAHVENLAVVALDRLPCALA